MNPSHVPVSQDAPELDFATLDLLPYGIIVVDEQGVIFYYNAREEQISGRARESVIGKNFFTEVAPCTQVAEFYGRFTELMRTTAGAVASFHFNFPFPERPREVEISLSGFQKDGAYLCLISVSDVTEKEELRERLLRSERLREIGEVAAGVAHNFNNLLTVIRGNAELILKVAGHDERFIQRVARIMKASDDGAEMLKRIRASSFHQPPPEAIVSQTNVDLNQLVKESIAFVEDYARMAEDERAARVSFAFELAESLPAARGTASELREVLTNLLRNAVDAIEGSGRISVRTRAAQDYVLAEVSDTGGGMSREAQDKLFVPLFTTKGERGTGLGLATCYAIVRRHQGDIRVESRPGQGTTFVVQLPVSNLPF